MAEEAALPEAAAAVVEKNETAGVDHPEAAAAVYASCGRNVLA